MKNITYSIQGWTDKKTMADFSKDGYTKIGAKRVFNKMMNSGKFQMIVLRKEIDYGYCSTSEGIEKYESGKYYVYKNKQWNET